MKKILCAMLLCIAMMLCIAATAESNVATANGVGYTSLQKALNEAAANSTVQLLTDVEVGTTSLEIGNGVTLDLNHFTLTTKGTYGGIRMKGDSSIINGDIVHNGTVCAIKAWNVDRIEGVDITVSPRSGKTINGIVLQEGSSIHVNTIKDVTITGATCGIETYNCGSSPAPVITSLENVNIDASKYAMQVLAPLGTATGCTFSGDELGIYMYRKGLYSVTLTLEDCEVTGDEIAIYVNDEKKNNTGTVSLVVDIASTLNCKEDNPIIRSEFEDTSLVSGSLIAASGCYYTDANGTTHYFKAHSWVEVANGEQCENCGKLRPSTGDAADLMLWAALLLAGSVVLTSALRTRKESEY